MDRMASGLILMGLGVVLLLFWYRSERAAREATFSRLSKGAL